jgi:hypothetical protein
MATQEYVNIQREAPEVEALKLGLMESGRALADIPLDIPDYQIAGLTSLQQDALTRAGAAYDPTADIQAAKDYYGATIGQDPAAVQAAMNPFTEQVIQNAQQDILDQSQMQQNVLADQAQAVGAFGGGRADMMRGIMAAEAAKEAGRLGADLRMQGFDMAMNRLGSAAQGIAGLGQLQQGLEQQGIGFGFDVGSRAQAQQQAELDTLRQNQVAQQMEPYQRLGFLSDIYQGAPTSAMTFTQGTAPASASPMQQLFGYGIAGLSAAAGANQLGLFG